MILDHKHYFFVKLQALIFLIPQLQLSKVFCYRKHRKTKWAVLSLDAWSSFSSNIYFYGWETFVTSSNPRFNVFWILFVCGSTFWNKSEPHHNLGSLFFICSRQNWFLIHVFRFSSTAKGVFYILSFFTWLSVIYLKLAGLWIWLYLSTC